MDCNSVRGRMKKSGSFGVASGRYAELEPQSRLRAARYSMLILEGHELGSLRAVCVRFYERKRGGREDTQSRNSMALFESRDQLASNRCFWVGGS